MNQSKEAASQEIQKEHIRSLEFSTIGIGIISIIIVFGVYILLKGKKRSQRKIKAKLCQKKIITHDTLLFTFIPNDKAVKSLGLNVGQHIQIEAIIDGSLVKRKYTPVSSPSRLGSFELLIKVYKKCQQFPKGGLMSQYLESLQVNDQINMTFPFGKLNYQGNKVVSIKEPNNKIARKSYNTFYMVAGGTGITPIYQIIQYISENQLQIQKPDIILIFANKSEDDILLKKELENYAKVNTNFTLHFCVDKPKYQGWKGFIGFLDQEKINRTLPSERQIPNTLFLSCGPFIMSNIVEKIWMSKKIAASQIHRF